jgi:glycosyltransferase involved in cell wall biosynthesis
LDYEPKISVITACYNHGRFINDMIESVMNQTLSDYELIIVNDGSTDDTKDILKKIIHEKIKIFHTENQGPACARNTAIKYARASIIMNLDADDKIAPDLLVKAYSVFCNGPNVGIVHCEARFFGARSGRFDIADYTLEAMLYENRIISQAFFRKEDWESVGGYSDELIYGMEDWDFWLSLIEQGREVVKIPEELVYYRTYSNLADCRSGRRKADRMKALESKVIIFRRHKKLISSYPGALKHYSKLENKFKNENNMVRSIKNSLYNFLKRYYIK